MNKLIFNSFIFLFILFTSVFAIYEEEIGKKDWSIRGIGQLENSLYISNDNTLLVQSKLLHRINNNNNNNNNNNDKTTSTIPSYAISLLDASNGNSKWRQLLPNQEQSFQSLKLTNDNNYILTLSNNNKIRYWNRKSGDLISVFDTGLANEDQCYNVEFIEQPPQTHTPIIRVLCKNNILILKKDDNNQINLVSNIENKQEDYSTSSSSLNSKQIYSINQKTKEIKLNQIESDKDNLNFKLKLIQTLKIQQQEQQVEGLIKNINSNDLIILYQIDSIDFNLIYKSNLINIKLDSIDSNTNFKIQSISQINNENEFLIYLNDQLTVLLVQFNKNTNKVELLKKKSIESKENTIVSIENNENNQNHLILINGEIIKNKEELNQFYNLLLSNSNNSKGIKLPKLSLRDNGLIKRLFSFNSKDSNKQFIVITMSDWSINMFELNNGVELNHLWSKEESLSFILTSEIIDYPLPDISKLAQLSYEFNETDGFFAHFSKRISTQLSSLFGGGSGSSNNQLDNNQNNDGEGSIKKVVIVSTLSGKVFGLNSSKGQIIWSIYYQQFLQESMKMKIYVTKKAIYYPPEIAIVYQVNEKPKSIISFVNPIEGKENSSIIVNSQMLHSQVLSQWIDPISHRQMMYWVVNYPIDHPSPMVTLYPWNEQIRKSWTQLKQSYFFLVDKENSEIKGFGVESLANGKHGTMKSLPTWNLNFGKNNQILQVSSFNPHEIIQSPAIILGNRNLLPKYVNRNLISVATLDSTTSTLNIHLVDSITGEIIKSFKHQHSSPRVSLVQTENSVVYSHYDILTATQLISTIDLFEKNIDWKTETFSSYNSTFDATNGGSESQLIIKHKSFVYPYGPIKTLSLSITTKGITSKNIIIGMENGQIVPIDKKFINARRPYPNEVTPNDAEEQLIPYKPLIQFPPWFFMTYNTIVTGLVDIESTGTDLESTSLVFTFGEPDVFCILISPSLPYDILSDQFNHLALIITSITLLILAILAKNYKYSLILSKKWK